MAFLNKHYTVTAIHKIIDNWIQNIAEGQLPVSVFLYKNALIPLVILFSFQNKTSMVSDLQNSLGLIHTL